MAGTLGDMGNREDLLAGAVRCLYTKGYARTTARDIAAASGVSLAAIGYHYRSKEALLNAALIQAIGEWGAELEHALAAETDPTAEPLEQFEATWERILASFDTHRQLWAATFEVFAQIDRAPEVRQFLADALQQGRLGLASLFQHIDAGADVRSAWVVGSFYQALLTGVLAQWLADPEHAPSGHDLAEALRTILAAVTPVTPVGARATAARGGPVVAEG